jgi:hypothetical protein
VNADEEQNSRDKKLLPVFQVVKFPNDPCSVTGGSKNGTCYTAEECSNKGGVNAGSCASGFGVCCTFTLTCGGSSTENCTYFDSATTVNDGACRAEICKLNSNICQIRLDFSTFVITGPTTTSTSVVKVLAGAHNTGGVGMSETTQCQTDTFTITNQVTVPLICGTNSGYHVYFDASDACNSLDFQLGNNVIGASTVTRSWSIKVNQYSCDYENLAPGGCTQYHFGSSGTNYVYTFNYQSSSSVASGKHLADQRQIICVRRETGNCKICWSADANTDVSVSGKVTAAGFGQTIGTFCCGWQADGQNDGTKDGYDCLMIPGALKASDSAVKSPKVCGSQAGLVTVKSAVKAASTTLCSKQTPFRISFHSDSYEGGVGAANLESSGGNTGVKLRYFQTTC